MRLVSTLAVASLMTGCAMFPSRAVPPTSPPPPSQQQFAALDHKQINWVSMVQAYMYAGR